MRSDQLTSLDSLQTSGHLGVDEHLRVHTDVDLTTLCGSNTILFICTQMESEMGLVSQRVTVNTFQLHGGKGIQYSCIVSTGVNTGLRWYLGVTT